MLLLTGRLMRVFKDFVGTQPGEPGGWKAGTMIATWPMAALFPILRTCLFART